MLVILDFSILRGTKPRMLTPKTYDDHHRSRNRRSERKKQVTIASSRVSVAAKLTQHVGICEHYLAMATKGGISPTVHSVVVRFWMCHDHDNELKGSFFSRLQEFYFPPFFASANIVKILPALMYM